MSESSVYLNGVRGEVVGDIAPADGRVSVRLESGGVALVPAYLIVATGSASGGSIAGGQPAMDIEAAGRGAESELVVPVVEERLTVTKNVIERGGVRIVKSVEERMVTVDEPLSATRYEVTRVPLDRVLSEAETSAGVRPRQEGDTMIYPVLEEIAVVEKRLRLVEEIHVTRRVVTEHSPQEIGVRREVVALDRIGA